ncbi:DUF599 domain-containing protein [Amphritea balenae]|uniref:DUF599 family protein n=1 Tax=Amphritea balenae TaxID=452629 RepID=A0A3P1SVA5_9GAMM|nr:DUF599 family protein [Amphritea balenae]RRD01091.1 DUF599 family protein [Amphritea balenae]GGK60047.1 hypothetical protein GCM10007941_07860 [Amphritea balenae]
MQQLTDFIMTNWINLLAMFWFLACFKGYNAYTRKRAKDTYCLASLMHQYRLQWMTNMLSREVRIADTTAIANLERSVSFFASSTMLILAGLMTVLGSTEKVIDVIDDIPFAGQATKTEWELKLLLLIGLFVYAFFKFTWSLRQYGFTSVMIGGAPMPDQVNGAECKAHANRLAVMSSMAANNFNLGLRTYYFSLAVLGWFVNPWVFMGLTAGVVFILYRREFKSSTLRQLVISNTD